MKAPANTTSKTERVSSLYRLLINQFETNQKEFAAVIKDVEQKDSEFEKLAKIITAKTDELHSKIQSLKNDNDPEPSKVADIFKDELSCKAQLQQLKLEREMLEPEQILRREIIRHATTVREMLTHKTNDEPTQAHTPLTRAAWQTVLTQFHSRYTKQEDQDEKLAIKHRVFRALRANAESSKIRRHIQYARLLELKCAKLKVNFLTRGGLDRARIAALEGDVKFRLAYLGFSVGFYFAKRVDSCFYHNLMELTQDLAKTQQLELAALSVGRYSPALLAQFRFDVTDRTQLNHLISVKLNQFFPAVTDETLVDVQKRADVDALQYLIYKRFSGRYSSGLLHHHLPNTPLGAFQGCYMNTNNIEVLIRQFKAAMQQQEEDWRNRCWYQWPMQDLPDKADQEKLVNLPFQNHQRYRCPVQPTKSPYSQADWKGDQDLIARARSQKGIITVSHGGGFFHILELLLGVTRGAQHDSKEAWGIYAFPIIDATYSARAAIAYAYGRTLLHFDQPARLIMKINTRHLYRWFSMGAEVFIRSTAVELVHDVKIERLGNDNSFAVPRALQYEPETTTEVEKSQHTI